VSKGLRAYAAITTNANGLWSAHVPSTHAHANANADANATVRPTATNVNANALATQRWVIWQLVIEN
jgi:hypothetical protein